MLMVGLCAADFTTDNFDPGAPRRTYSSSSLIFACGNLPSGGISKVACSYRTAAISLDSIHEGRFHL